MDEDPYRSGHPTESDGELDRLVCVRGCGEWYPRARLEQVLGWDDVRKAPGGIGLDGRHAQATSWPWGAALCPICQAEMSVGFRAQIRFDYCAQHGLWLDAGEIQQFAQAFKRS